MCRSIKVLRRSDALVTSEEISAAALQFVRKVSGFHKPSKANQTAFDAAVRDIAGITEQLLNRLGAAQPRRPAVESGHTSMGRLAYSPSESEKV
jgi:hypothetical protein